MNNVIRMTSVLSLTALFACSEPPAAPEQPAPTPQAETAAPTQISEDRQGILTNTQREGLNSANQVSGLLEDAEAERRKRMEAQGL